MRQLILSEQNFENFPVRVVFQKRKKMIFFQRLPTSDRHNFAMITDRLKFITKITLYGMSSFHFHRLIQFKVVSVTCALRTSKPPQIFSDVGHDCTACHNADGLSGRGLMTSLWEEKDRSCNKITGNWIMNCLSTVGNWYVSNAAMTLATVLATIPVLLSDGTRRYGVAAPFSMLQVQTRDVQII